jgi:hypothetical protein
MDPSHSRGEAAKTLGLAHMSGEIGVPRSDRRRRFGAELRSIKSIQSDPRITSINYSIGS